MTKNKLLIILSAVVICACVVGAILVNMSLHNVLETMKFIEGRYRGGRFVDYDNSIGVESADDIGYWYKDGKYVVKYGKLELAFSEKNLRDPVYQQACKNIGLEAKGNLEEHKVVWYFQGQRLEEWVPN